MENSFFFYANNKLKPTQICVPLTSENISEIISDAAQISKIDPDLIEWRADQIWDFNKDIKPCADAVAAFTKEIPLLFTWRTHRDGGRHISDNQYMTLINWAIQSQIFSIVDIELSLGADNCDTLIKNARNNGIETLLSFHDFHKTPSSTELLAVLAAMAALKPTAVKIAVMPTDKLDVLSLIEANIKFKLVYPDLPTVAISMGELGKITRLAGDFIESAFTFATVTKGSAPGQTDIKTVRKALSLFDSK